MLDDYTLMCFTNLHEVMRWFEKQPGIERVDPQEGGETALGGTYQNTQVRLEYFPYKNLVKTFPSPSTNDLPDFWEMEMTSDGLCLATDWFDTDCLYLDAKMTPRFRPTMMRRYLEAPELSQVLYRYGVNSVVMRFRDNDKLSKLSKARRKKILAHLLLHPDAEMDALIERSK